MRSIQKREFSHDSALLAPDLKNMASAKLDMSNKQLNLAFDLIYSESEDEIRSLLAENPSLLLERDFFEEESEGYTLLHEAAYHGNPKMAELLLDSGAQINALAKNDETPLHVAAMQRNYGTAILLLERNADFELRDKRGYTALIIAAMKTMRPAQKQFVERLLAAGANFDLNSAVRMGRYDIVQEILRRRPSAVNECPVPGALLHDAVQNQLKPTIKVLLVHGANVNESYGGNMPLHRALLPQGDKGIVRLLLDYGANPNAKDHIGETCIRYAQKVGRLDLKELLVKYGAR